MAEQSISITVPTVTGSAPQVTDKVTDVVVQNTVTNVVYTDKVTDVASDAINVQTTGVGEEAVPNPNLFTRGQDYTTLTDSFSKYSLKPQFDTFSTADAFARLVNYRRPFTELQVASDSYQVASVGKTLRDTGTLTETFVKGYSKVTYDVSSTVDVSSLRFGKTLFDQIVQADEVTKLTYQKVQPDQVISADVFSRIVDYKRTFSDWVDATDDFLGEANIDDDQIALIGKNIVDYGTLTDLHFVGISSIKSDLADVGDLAAVLLAKPFADFVNNADQSTYLVSKVFSDTSSLGDTNLKLVGKTAADTSTTYEERKVWASKVAVEVADAGDETSLDVSKVLSDQFTKYDTITLTWSILRAFTEQQTTSELTTFGVSSTKLDIATTSEVISKFGTKLFTTEFTQSDLFNRTVSYIRSFSDQVDATDDFLGAANIDDDQIAYVGKNIVDYSVTSELVRFDGTKLLIDTTAILNPISLNTSKILSDSFTKVDVTVLQTIKTVADTTSTAELTEKYTQKIASNSFAVTDPASLTVTKPFSDTTGQTTDTFSRVVDYSRLFTDLVDATDDFLGEANIDDDQVASFGKNVIDYLALGDAPQFDFSSIRSDQYVVADLATKNSGKVLVTNFGYSDTANFYTNKQLVDTASYIEVVAKSTGKSLSDTANSSDTASKTGGKQVVDVFASTETSYRNAGKVASEILYTADVLTFLKYINPQLYETANAVDSGFINNQSYFAGTYVEPGYVGTNTYFT